MKRLFWIFLILRPVCTGAQPAERYEVVITELFADPLPVVGLPAKEFVELFNTSAREINLRGWQLSDGHTTGRFDQDYLLMPGQYLIACASADQSLFYQAGPSMGINPFPTLNNQSDTIALISAEGKIIHAVAYDMSTYGNRDKAAGGWSLEMMDLSLPCETKGNWIASTDPSGGTPGKENSVRLSLAVEDFHIVQAFALDSLSVYLVFNRGVDSIGKSPDLSFHWTGSANPILHAEVLPPLFDVMRLRLSVAIEKGKIYELKVQDIKDGQGNGFNLPQTIKLGLPVAAVPGDLVINEILFHPRPGDGEYVELFHNGKNLLDLGLISIGTRNSAGDLQNIRKLYRSHKLVFPGDFPVFTDDPKGLLQHYTIEQKEYLNDLPDLPALPDKKGSVVILNDGGEILDELSYEESWQFPLLEDPAGVALERIDPNMKTSDPGNWHSAAADRHYGTPASQNSQFMEKSSKEATFSLSPTVFSPDNDGRDDILQVNYRFGETGYTCNLRIFDPAGRPVRYLAKNSLCGREGYYLWDGLDERNQPLKTGIYIVFAEIFNLRGIVKRFREAVVLARNNR